MFKKAITFVLLLVMVSSIFCACAKGEEKFSVPNFDDTPTFDGLSYETERQICQAYYELICKEYKEKNMTYNGKLDDTNIFRYFGTYDGCPAVEFSGGGWFMYYPCLVGGVYFYRGNLLEIFIFKDNKLVYFIDAYNDGFLMREDLKSIQSLRHDPLDDEFLDFSERTMWDGNIDEDFDDQTIIVTVLKPYTNFTFKCVLEEYALYPRFWEVKTGDFASINAISVEKISGDIPDWSEETMDECEAYRQILEVKIANKGKQNVIDAIRKLEDFDFVQSATPKYFE